MKKLAVFLTIFISFTFIGASVVDAYVSVKGYYRSNGTYVKPHVRSNPNGLKYDNYGWKPSQGLYNKTYGTRGSTWDTSTYITDPDYSLGKSLYESNQTKTTVTPSTSSTSVSDAKLIKSIEQQILNLQNQLDKSPSKASISKTKVPKNASLSSYGSTWYCDSGYKATYDSNYNKKGCKKIIVPKNAFLSYSGNTWYCDDGYKTSYDSNYNKAGCNKIIVPKDASLSYTGNTWYCDHGYKTTYDSDYEKKGCKKIIVPQHAYMSTYSNSWYCDDGYTTIYDDSYSKEGCEKE
jgi:hypothetical protein